MPQPRPSGQTCLRKQASMFRSLRGRRAVSWHPAKIIKSSTHKVKSRGLLGSVKHLV